jgi:alkylation response protein AidB-like acyl-CoA dehydrogenase
MSQPSHEYRSAVDRVATDTARKTAPDVDHEAAFPTASIQEARDSGLLGLISAAEVGGQGHGFRAAAEVIERLARECGSTAMVLAMHYCGTAVIEKLGPVSTRREIAAGGHFTTLAFSETGSRSMFWVPVSTAVRENGMVRLDAKKSWVTSASHSQSYVWSSRPVEAGGASTIWLVPADAPGLSVPRRFEGLGLRGNDSTPVVAEGVRIPEDHRLGEDGQGFSVMMEIVLPIFNVLNAACSVGLMEGAIRRSADHLGSTRFEHLDQSLAEQPVTRLRLAEAKVQADMARALLQDTVSALEEGREDAVLRVLECKAAAADTAREVLGACMRVSGGAAFRKDVGVERFFRDAQAAAIMAPTSDVLYDFIGKSVCGLPLF